MNDHADNRTWVGPEDALDELARRTAMLDAVGYAATRIVVGDDWRGGIQELLNRLGRATESSRVSLFEIHPGPNGRLAESCRYDWTEPGQPPMSGDPRYQNMPLVDADGVVDDWTLRRQRGEVVQAMLRDLTGYNRQVFEDTSTLSFISVPIMLRGGCWGFLAFDGDQQEPGLDFAHDGHLDADAPDGQLRAGKLDDATLARARQHFDRRTGRLRRRTKRFRAGRRHDSG